MPLRRAVATKRKKYPPSPGKLKVLKALREFEGEQFTGNDIIEISGESKAIVHRHLISHLGPIRDIRHIYNTEKAIELMKKLGEL